MEQKLSSDNAKIDHLVALQLWSLLRGKEWNHTISPRPFYVKTPGQFDPLQDIFFTLKIKQTKIWQAYKDEN